MTCHCGIVENWTRWKHCTISVERQSTRHGLTVPSDVPLWPHKAADPQDMPCWCAGKVGIDLNKFYMQWFAIKNWCDYKHTDTHTHAHTHTHTLTHTHITTATTTTHTNSNDTKTTLPMKLFCFHCFWPNCVETYISALHIFICLPLYLAPCRQI